jgi:membrane protein CcdC involved in cytochrome C biogenesis
MHTWLVVSSLIGGALVIAYRVRETTRPVTPRKIIIPPLGMSTGFSMFAYAPARIPPLWALAAFAMGALVLSYPLVKSSRLHIVGDAIMLQRSRAFLWIIFGLFALRVAARSYVEQYVSAIQTGAIFFVLAFGMIVTWRVRMYLEYRKLKKAVEPARAKGTGWDKRPSAALGD